MAKTYESKEEIGRERLNEEARSDKRTSLFSAFIGMASITSGGLLLSALNRLEGTRRKFVKILGITNIAGGAAILGLSFLLYKWTKEDEDKIKQPANQQSNTMTENTSVNDGLSRDTLGWSQRVNEHQRDASQQGQIR